jgi:uncharacterized protein YggE
MDKKVTLSVRSLLGVGLVALALVAAYLIGRAGPAPASAQPDDQSVDSASTVTVTGVGHVAVVPDQLGFQLSVSVLRDDLDQAMNDGSTSMQSVVDALKAAGVADKDVQTTDVSLYPEYSHQRGQPRTLRGYRVNQTVSVTVEDLTKGSAVVGAALAAGGSGVSLDGLQLQVGDPDGSLEPARSDAFDQAKAKAQEYADHAGRELGDVVRISEVSDQPLPGDLSYADSAASAVRGPAPLPIQAGQDDLTASVIVVYELK